MKEIPSDFSPEQRSERAREIFNQGYNCCQAVVLAFSDLLDIPEKEAATLASGFGGGVGHMREVCGTVSGMAFMAGQIRPVSPQDKTSKPECYALVQKMAGEFRQMNGSIICRELLGLDKTKTDDSAPAERTPEYYKKRPCGELCAMAAGIVARTLLESRKKD